MKMFNHGVFAKTLEETIEELLILEKTKTDPYEKWNVKEQIDIVKKILIMYKESVKAQIKS